MSEMLYRKEMRAHLFWAARWLIGGAEFYRGRLQLIVQSDCDSLLIYPRPEDELYGADDEPTCSRLGLVRLITAPASGAAVSLQGAAGSGATPGDLLMSNAAPRGSPGPIPCIELLLKVPALWAPWPTRNLSAVEERELGRLVHAGLVEIGATQVCELDGGERCRAMLRFTGQFESLEDQTGQLFREMRRQVEEQLSRKLLAFGPDEERLCRLTESGIDACNDIASGGVENVADFIFACGRYKYRPSVTVKVHVEEITAAEPRQAIPGTTPKYMTAEQLASKIGQNVKKVRVVLTRLATDNPFIRTEASEPGARKRYLYLTERALPLLEKHFKSAA